MTSQSVLRDSSSTTTDAFGGYSFRVYCDQGLPQDVGPTLIRVHSGLVSWVLLRNGTFVVWGSPYVGITVSPGMPLYHGSVFWIWD